MTLAPGTRLGAYHILSAVGAGGMGEVYKARDAKLDRDVAIKVLPPAFAADPDRIARLEREAKTLASLNHPNIAHIYGLEDSTSPPALVMEFVEGPTLADRIARGPMPLEEALPIARQIAEALEAAHEQGIIHRDLKPANVKVRPDNTVKVLDFGLAKAMDQVGVSSANVSMSPTITSPPVMTGAGVLLGTAAYMAPEQARGKAIDNRADIWAFGCVLFEMLTGRSAFTGDDTAELLANVLKSEPDWQALPADVPPVIRALLTRCLEKDGQKRIAHVSIVKFLLTSYADLPVAPSATVSSARARQRRWLAIALASLFVLVTMALGLWTLRFAATSNASAAPVPPPHRFDVSPPANALFSGGRFYAPGQVLSPDGRQMVFQAQRAGEPAMLWVRTMASQETHGLAGTENGNKPFWRPDGGAVAFFAGAKLKVIDLATSSVRTICDASSGEGGSWNHEGLIVFTPTQSSGIFTVAETGGQPMPVTTLDAGRGEISHRWPDFLPDGRHFLFLVEPSSDVRVGSLDGGAPINLLAAESKAVYAAPGHVLFVRDGTLMAQPFDPSSLRLTGAALPLATQIRVNPIIGRSAFSVSQTGILAYRVDVRPMVQPTWVNRAGKVLALAGSPCDCSNVDVSRDAVQVLEDRRQTPTRTDIWAIDSAGGSSPRTFGPLQSGHPLWSYDSSRIAFESNREGGIRNLYTKLASGAGADKLLWPSPAHKVPTDWSRDGTLLVYQTDDPQTGSDVWVFPLVGNPTPRPVLQTPKNEGDGRLSPDGHWIAYVSDESGRNEVYVQPFPPSGGKWQVSTTGGMLPNWRSDGKEIVFAIGESGSSDLTVNAVEIRVTGSELHPVLPPKVLFKTQWLPNVITVTTPMTATGGTNHPFAMSADGQRFLILKPVGPDSESPVTILANWPAALEKASGS
jgi:serine/threonine protein kinase/Tol biopolymer transport system component